MKLTAPRPSLAIETGHATAIGHVRARQEDRLLCAPPIIAVADGMGGLSQGDIAAQAAIDALRAIRFPGSTVGARTEIKKAIVRAERTMSKAASECGTTLVGAVLGRATSKDSWLVFHVGDSRMYSYRDGELERLTVDHSVVQELVDAGMITREQARYDPRRGIVTRAVAAGAPSEPTFRHVEACGQILIACSDGISDELTDWEISDIMRRSEHRGLGAAAQELVDAALDSGGRDNATVVLARAVPEGKERQ